MAQAHRPLTRHVEQVMGLPVSLAIRGRHATSAEGAAAWAAALATLRAADEVFSTYRTDSWICRLGRDDVAVEDCPPEVAEVLALAEIARRDSEGAFDVHLPRPDGSRLLEPSGIVKGWAGQRAAEHLHRLRDTDFCLSLGGDIVCSTGQATSPDWRIGIEDPRDPAQVFSVVALRDGAIATSGLVHRGAHIVDPRNGRTPRVWASVSVIAPTLVEADVDATAAFVLEDEAPAWLAARGRQALLVHADGSVRTVGSVPATTAH